MNPVVPEPADDRRVLVIGPNPTPNGDLHLGHIAGPYLGGDVYARYQRARGREVVYTTGSDDSQTFVVASARRLGVTPPELCRTATASIARTLADMGISVDSFGPFDDGYRATVLEFLSELHAAGKFRLRTVRIPYLERTSEFLVEGMICGYCPICLAESRGGLCETCGHPNNFDELINPRSTVDPADVPVAREARILVLPLEDYRAELTAYHQARAPYWRPSLVQLMREALARPLPDFPITYPLDWGIPAPFPETPGQVLNAWAETIPAGMYTAAHAAAQRGQPTSPGELWRAENDMRLVHFLGFDNAYFWSLPYLALLMAHGGRYILPDTIVSNEFYELESEKFSTSKGHVVWCHELLREVPRDLIRFYLASTAPEHQRTSFSRAGLDKVVGQRLVEPWNRLSDLLGKAAVNQTSALPVSAAARDRTVTMLRRFSDCFEFPGFSLTRIAALITAQLDRLQQRAALLGENDAGTAPGELGDLFLEVKALATAASPILIDMAEAARRTGALEGALTVTAFDVPEIRPFAIPLLGAAPRQAAFR